jgi:hypothetical protein
MRYRCTVIFLDAHDKLLNVCEQDADEEIDTEYINEINQAWLVPGHRLIGNHVCNEHMAQMGEI